MKRLLALFIVLALPFGAVFSQKKDTYRVRTVVIDPGHGGAKPGAKGSKSWEKDITLSVAKKFGKLLSDNYKDMKIIYTRTTDADISLAERARIANSNKADLFISIHANSHPTASPSGVETFVMGLSESKANLEVAKKENADILLEADYKNNKDYSGFDPNAPETYVMLAMFQNAFIDKSLNLAQAIQTQYKQNLRTINRGVKQAELYVLYKTTCPSVLTEIGFISNPTEEAFMLSDEGQAKIAVSLFNAFMTYKATEEGSDKPANPKIDLPGYGANKPAPKEQPKEAPKPEPTPEAKPEPKIVNSQLSTVNSPEPAPEIVNSQLSTVNSPEPVAAAVDTAVAKEQPKEEPAPEIVNSQLSTVKDSSQLSIVNSQLSIPAKSPIAEKPTPSVALPQRPAPQAQPQPQAPATLPAPQHSAKADASRYYTVQFLVAPVLYEAGAAQLGGVDDFIVTRKAQSYVYTTGRFATYAEATQYCKSVRTLTPFKDAWVFQTSAAPSQAVSSTQQQEGTKVQEAEKKQETAKKQETPKPDKAAPKASGPVTYRIQFCSSPRVMKDGDPDLHGIHDFRYGKSGNLYIYTAGNYSSLAEARSRCSSIQKSTPFRDAFVIAIHNGQRIPLDRAAELEKQAKRR